MLYGLALGAGVGTWVSVSTFYVAVLWAVLNGNPALGGSVLAAFGIGRAFPVLWLTGQQRNVAEAFQFMQALMGWEAVVHIVNGMALGFVGAWLLAGGIALL